jgi:hypothetical protein
LHLTEKGTASLPGALDYKNVIKDYLNELGKDIKRRVRSHWHRVDFNSQVVIVITVTKAFQFQFF